MFTPKLNASRSKFSSLSGSRGSAQGRRSIGLFTPQRKAGYSSRNQTLNRSSLQTSQIVEETAQHRLEAYGSALPVLVTEALTQVDVSTAVSVKLSETGWAWLVCGRSLFIWRYKSNYGKSFQCKELSLPPSELNHHVDLVSVMPRSEDGSMVACVAVSPEGVARYWASINHEGAFCEVATELKGEECAKLIALKGGKCILGTTSSTLILLTPSIGSNQLIWRVLRAPQGVFGGIGRRMSSFIFGSVATQATNAPLHQLVVAEDEEQMFYTLSGGCLYKWELEEPEQLVYQCEVDRMLRECISRTVWGQDVSQLPNLKTWLIDMQCTGDSVVILAAGMNPDISGDIYYILGTLRTEGQDPPQSFLSFTVPKFNNIYKEDEEEHLLSYNLLIPDPSKANTYLYKPKVIHCMSVSSSTHLPDKIDFRTPGDKILGAGICDDTALFFSSVHGVIAVRDIHQPPADVSMNESLANMSYTKQELGTSFAETSVLGNVTPSLVQEMSTSEDKTARLKAALFHCCRGNMSEAQTLVEELFPPDMPRSTEPGSMLDILVSNLSQEMIDDFPASDPRWAESVPHDAGGGSGSLILMHQLEDKLRAHEYLLSFLKNIGLWERLGTVKVRDAVMSTRMLLCEHAEKVTAALTLRSLHTQNTPLIDRAIRTVLDWRREIAPPSGLTAQDLFYRRVSRIHEILESMQVLEEEGLKSDVTPREVVALLAKINTIFVGILQDSIKYRESKAVEYQSTLNCVPEPEYVPWTASMGPKGIRAMISKQYMLTVEQALPAVQDTSERAALFKLLMDLANIILDGYKTQLESIRQTVGETPHYREILQRYEQERTNILLPFLQCEQYERAASLAEKYLDFATLVQICENTDNQERLNRYMAQFQNKGFPDFVFKSYVEQGKRGKLFSSNLASHPQLGRFLQSKDNKFISWLHDVQTGDFFKAHITLRELAMEEVGSMSKKKTLLSLSKLAALATDDPVPSDLEERLEAINHEHDLILHQETLPQAVIEGLGMDAENMKVIAPKELVELYTSEYNVSANEFDFKKALDLLQCLDKNDPENEYENLLLHIWCQAILRDESSWTHIPSDDPIERSKDTVFFRTIELAHSEGLNLQEFLPPVDRLLEAEGLGNLRDEPNFCFLIKAGYERIQRGLL